MNKRLSIRYFEKKKNRTHFCVELQHARITSNKTKNKKKADKEMQAQLFT